MGVYINMKMPKNCCSCPLFKSNMSKQLFCKAFGAFDKSDYDKLPIERMKNCPLVFVPPHGDLIDRKQLIKSDHQHYEYMSDEFYITVRDIECAPTVIPAVEE